MRATEADLMRDSSRPLTGPGAKLIFATLVLAFFGAAFLLKTPQQAWLLLPTEAPIEETEELIVEVPDFSAIQDVDTKKRVFFDFLQPFVDAENNRIHEKRLRLRDLITKIEQGVALARNDRMFIRELAQEYELETESYTDQSFLSRLLRRVDVIPPSLVLAQAANESAWGTSRFAQEANNFFGQWCYSEGCGLVPKRRRASARHEVKAFDSIKDAVTAYFININTFPSYLDLRLIRESLRENAKPIDGISLTNGLGSYSERGEDYIDELQSMIYYNQLLERDSALTQQSLD